MKNLTKKQENQLIARLDEINARFEAERAAAKAARIAASEKFFEEVAVPHLTKVFETGKVTETIHARSHEEKWVFIRMAKEHGWRGRACGTHSYYVTITK